MGQAQWELVLQHLKTGATITPREAVALWECWRLGARISEVKEYLAANEPELVVVNDGEKNGHGSTHGKYRLVKKQEAMI